MILRSTSGDAANTISRLNRDIASGITAPGTTIAQMLQWLDGASALKEAYLEKYGIEGLEELRAFSHLQSDLLMAEVRQMQVNQMRGEVVPVKALTEIRDLTVTLMQDVCGPALIAQLTTYGVPEELARRPRESLLRGIQQIYAEYGQKLLNGG